MLLVATICIPMRLPPQSEAVNTINARSREASGEGQQINGGDLSWTTLESLATLQLELLLAYRAYGCNQITRASTHLKQACPIALPFGLRRLDQPDPLFSKLLDEKARIDGESPASGNGVNRAVRIVSQDLMAVLPF